jgi:(1->4)-alpha-D-glucan 1-alpha-D-glucosylmutase
VRPAGPPRGANSTATGGSAAAKPQAWGDHTSEQASESLRQLAQAHGIALAYHDIRGELRQASAATLAGVLAAMGVEAGDDAHNARAQDECTRAQWQRRIDPLVVVRSHALPSQVRIRLPVEVAARPLALRIASETGTETVRSIAPPQHGEHGVDGDDCRCLAFDVALDDALPCGYHALEVLAGDAGVARATLAVAPSTCHRPRSLQGGGRAWGTSVQLYGVRSARNWGIGDFTDLAGVVERWGAAGADIVGVNPLHALFPHDPEHASPYSPSSRAFVNVLYLDVEAIPEFARCAAARRHVASGAFQAALAALRAAPLVDYAGVARAKWPVLEMLHAHALSEAASTSDGRAFQAFKDAGGEALRRQALFDALQAHVGEHDPGAWGWTGWPAAYRDPQAPEVAAFATAHAQRVDFFAWLQWQCAQQRAQVAKRAGDCGMRIGLYTDLAVSIARPGADAWASQDVYAMAASAGAPPDEFNVEGQDWGLPPAIPERLRDTGYASFIAMLRAAMQDAGALRIDHVMGLARLYWVPGGARPSHGAYVRYPFDDLLGLLALESERHRCLVIGEDLGTVPDEVRHAMAANDIFSYRVLLFERDASGAFVAPAAYPEPALAIASTHDLPTLAGWWEGADIRLRAQAQQKDGAAGVDAALADRVRDRGRLLDALAREGLLPDGTPQDPASVPALTPALAIAVQVYLARTPSALLVVQPEDVFGVREQANLPGVTTEHPNWRHKLPVALEDQDADERFRTLTSRLARERPRDGE